MEYKLNKIDTDIRKKIQEKTKNDKVHINEKINVKKDIKEDDNYSRETNQYKDERNERKYITIDGVKKNMSTFDVEVEKINRLSTDNSSGSILDITK